MPYVAPQSFANTGSIDGTPLGSATKPLDYVDQPATDDTTDPNQPTSTVTAITGGALKVKRSGATDAYQAPSTYSSNQQGLGLAGSVISIAKGYLGTPYVWGGTGPLGFDCSGLVQYVYGKVGINLPRISAQQARAGSAIAKSAAQPGDLIWWDENGRNEGADHIAIYLGNGQILEAPHTGANVRIRSLGAHENYGVTRVIGQAAPTSRARAI